MGEGIGIGKGSLHTCEDLTLMKEERGKKEECRTASESSPGQFHGELHSIDDC